MDVEQRQRPSPNSSARSTGRCGSLAIDANNIEAKRRLADIDGEVGRLRKSLK